MIFEKISQVANNFLRNGQKMIGTSFMLERQGVGQEKSFENVSIQNLILKLIFFFNNFIFLLDFSTFGELFLEGWGRIFSGRPWPPLASLSSATFIKIAICIEIFSKFHSDVPRLCKV